MGDMVEIFKAMNEEKRLRRQLSLKWNMELVLKSGVSFVTKNDGFHLILEDHIDFWPSSGKFFDRETGKYGQGLNKVFVILGVRTK